jgi:hypothetical protein
MSAARAPLLLPPPTGGGGNGQPPLRRAATAAVCALVALVAQPGCASNKWGALATTAPTASPTSAPAACDQFDCAAIFDPTLVGDYSGFNFQDFALLLCDEDTPVKSKNKECTTLALESPQAARPNKPPEGPAGDPNFVGPNIGLYVDLPAPRKRNDNGTKYNTPASTLGFKQIDERSCPAAGSLWFGEAAQRGTEVNFTFFLRPDHINHGCGWGKLRIFPSCSSSSIGGSGGPFGSAGPVTPVGAWQVNEFDGAFKTFPITNSWAKFSYTVPAPFDSGNNCMWDTINFINDNDAGSKCDYTFAMDDATFESDCIRQLPPTAAPTASPSMMPTTSPTSAPTEPPTEAVPTEPPNTFPPPSPIVETCCQELTDLDRYTQNYTAGYCASRAGAWAPGCPSPAVTGHGSAVAQCASQGMELCSLDQSFTTVPTEGGCPGSSKDTFWTDTPCETPSGVFKAEGFYTVAGDGSRYDCAVPSLTTAKVQCCVPFCAPTEDSALCCDEIEEGSWVLDRTKGVCSTSRVDGKESCATEVTWDQANTLCRAAGAYMCTGSNAVVGKDTGCNLEEYNVWTGEECVDELTGDMGYLTIRGNGNPATKMCTTNTSIPLGLRCCADACPLAISASTP